MYLLTLAAVVISSIVLMRSGLQRRKSARIYAGALILIGGLAIFFLMSFWAEYLWFDALGYASRFWTLVGARLGAVTFGAALAFGIAFLLAFRAGPHLRRYVGWIALPGGMIWGLLSWEAALLYLNRVSTGVRDPMLGLDTGFYLFVLPFLDSLFWLLLYAAALALAAAFLVWEQDGTIRLRRLQEPQGDPLVLPLANAGVAAVAGGGMLLALCHLLYSNWGVVMGPGWVDTQIRQPALLAAAAVFLVGGLLPLLPAFRRRMQSLLGRRLHTARPAVAALSAAWLAIALISVTLLVLIPGLVQWLVVKPNEITFEKPYIARNIEFTRYGFRLHEIEERQFVPAEKLSARALEDNQNLLSEVRLWDWRALDAVYKQFQEIRLYYEFVDVDIDRYQIGDRYRQVMVAARELAQHNLPAQSQTFVNRRFKFTHGYGITLATVSDFTANGLPNLLVRDIPPRVEVPELAIDRPEIYYGELSHGPAVVNTLEEEFDYPSGESNVYTRYQGTGGVQLSSLWRKILFGWKFDGTLFLLSGYPTGESRVMFHREIEDRVRTLAPFLVLDADPYIVVVNGRLYWILDAYTRSTYYPYSQPFDSREFIEYRDGAVGARTVSRLDGVNYVRNSVKVLVDAYNGSVDLYAFDDEDPIIRAWQRALPALFKPAEAMPDGIRRHVRYPQDFLLAQGLIFTKYHMSDPAVFYNQEDLWVRATEKHYHDIKPVEPYYVMWELPDSDHAEFVLILPFTPKNRQVLIGWIAGLSDGDNYGRFLAYKFPKEKRVLGPQQVESKIDQDSFLSGQLTLWDQQGSDVIRGNVLAIPVDNTLLYVEPIYLQAETAAYPELRLVAVMHGDKLSYAETFEAALRGLMTPGARGQLVQAGPAQGRALQAQAAFEGYLQALGNGEFSEASRQLERLSLLLNELVGAAAGADAAELTD